MVHQACRREAPQTSHGDLARSRQNSAATATPPARLSLHYIIHRAPSAAPVTPQAKQIYCAHER